jgi:hypothetical protein
MIRTMKKYVVTAALAALLQIGSVLAPAAAAESNMALLASYTGDWRGNGALVGGEEPEALRCRLNITKGNAGKINYSGRCNLARSTLSVSGTIAYNNQADRYEAAMSSNAGFTGVAVGQQRGSDITFNLREQQKDRGGSDVRIGATIILRNDQVRVDFEVEFNNSGEVLTAQVPFAR